MNTARRKFLKDSSLATSGFILMDPLKKISGLSSRLPALNKSLHTISVFHTNDLHNQIAPFANGQLSGYGGLKNVHDLLQQQDAPAVLVDAGDFLGTSCSRDEHQKMIHAMNRVGYHAATIGNAELKNGQEYLSELAQEMQFRLVNCNYEFSHEPLKQQVVPYHIIKWGQYKIGITGVGTTLDHASADRARIRFHHPYQRANAVARELKPHCDLVICLSHLGFEKNRSGYHNMEFAGVSENIDIIISGHERHLVPEPRVLKNAQRHEVILSHGGWGGLITRTLSFSFSNGQKHSMDCKNYAASSHANVGYGKAVRAMVQG